MKHFTAWCASSELDSFFTRIYEYHRRQGFACMFLEDILQLMSVEFNYILGFNYHLIHFEILSNYNFFSFSTLLPSLLSYCRLIWFVVSLSTMLSVGIDYQLLYQDRTNLTRIELADIVLPWNVAKEKYVVFILCLFMRLLNYKELLNSVLVVKWYYH